MSSTTTYHKNASTPHPPDRRFELDTSTAGRDVRAENEKGWCCTGVVKACPKMCRMILIDTFFVDGVFIEPEKSAPPGGGSSRIITVYVGAHGVANCNVQHG